MFESRLDLGSVQQAAQRVRAEMAKVVVGQEQMVDLLLAAILSDGHVLLEGVPGVAKTLSAKAVARTLTVGFSRIQFTPDLMPSDILGTMVFHPKDAEFHFKRGPIFSNVILVDEINRAPAKTQSALLEVMEERQVTVDSESRQMDKPFFVIATQNPVEHEGTYRLPEAQLDRFLFKILVGYPSPQQESLILSSVHDRQGSKPLDVVQPVLNAQELESVRALVQQVHVEAKLYDYITQIVHQTRNNVSLYLGASPRASIGILNAAKAIAALGGQDFVTPDHIREVSYPVLRHRIQLSPEREMEGAQPDDVIREIVEKTEVPR